MLKTQIKLDRAGIYSAERCSRIFARFMPSKPFATVTLIALLVAAATALKQLLMLTNTMLVSYVSQSIARDVRGRIFDKALSLDRPGFDSQGISGFTAHITHTTDMLANGITNFYGGAVTEPLRILACLGGAWLISWRLTLASLIFAPLAAFLILFLNRQIRGLSLRILDRSMGFHHVMLEVFNSLLTVQANTMEDFERRRFRESTSNIRRIAMKSTFYQLAEQPSDGVARHGHPVHGRHRFGLPGDQSGNAHLRHPDDRQAAEHYAGDGLLCDAGRRFRSAA